jgi:hypothetical protein
VLGGSVFDRFFQFLGGKEAGRLSPFFVVGYGIFVDKRGKRERWKDGKRFVII